MRRWRIQYVDIGGRSTPSVHLSRKSAEEELLMWLKRLLFHMGQSVGVWEVVGKVPPDRRAYLKDLKRIANAMEEALEARDVWKAYAAWRIFDEKWQRSLPWPEIGTVIVEETGT